MNKEARKRMWQLLLQVLSAIVAALTTAAGVSSCM